MLLVMINKKYQIIKILIFIRILNKLKDDLKTHNILKSIWELANLNTEIFILINKEFIKVLVKIMPNNKYKTRVKGLFCDGIYSFIYDIKTIKVNKFSNLRIFYTDNFQIKMNIAIKIQL